MATGNLFGIGGESNSLYGNSLSSGTPIQPSSFIYFEWFIFKTSASQPATPTGGSWNFLTNTGTAPTGWTSTVSGIPLDNLWFSIAFVDSRNPTNIVWSTPGLISATNSVYSTAYADTFTGDGVDTTWTLTQDPVVVNNLDVSINGVTQVPVVDYTISGTTFTTTTPAPLNSIILVKYRQALPNSYFGTANNVGYTPHNWIAATNVQAALDEVADDISANTGSSLVGYTPFSWIDANNVQLALNEIATDISATDGISGSNLVGYLPGGSGAVGTTVQDKLQQTVSVKDFGATGDGTTDDTTAIQDALDSGALEVVFPASGTYIIDGGLISNQAGQVISAYGATIKLKANATSRAMLRLNGAGSSVLGGTWDGNKANGNSGPTSGSTLPVEVYSSWNIGIFASRCTIKDCYSINTYGMFCTGGSVSDTLFQDNTVRNTVGYGFFLSSAVDAYRNRAIGNNIDMSEGVVWGQGILFTRTGSVRQYDWELSNNTVIGPQDAASADLAINLAVRGDKGIVSNNITRYGSMGFSEGGTDTVITGNSFLDLVGSVRYGIEVSGARTTVSGNTVSNAKQGVIVSGNISYDNLCITGNRIQSTENGIRLQIASGYTGRNISITGNNLTVGLRGVYTTRDITNLTISGNVMIGPGSGTSGAYGLYSETPEQDAYIFVQGNTVVGFQRAFVVYYLTALAINKLYATGNNISNDTTSSSRAWTFVGLATMGTDVIQAWGPTNAGLRENYLDGNIKFNIGTGTPEGVVTAAVGSLYLRSNGGAGTTLYVKESGTGNTGWVAK